MPTIEENLFMHNNYGWPQEGHEWSLPWHGTETLWRGTLFPRIQSFVPADTILEIAPGFGRITSYLLNFCKNLAVVDLTERCIEACRNKFSIYSHITYHVNDGKSLDMIPDNSIDFCISYGSLIHAEADVIEAYLEQLTRKFTPNGIGFIHHSNVQDCIAGFPYDMPPEKTQFYKMVFRQNVRAESVGAQCFAEICKKVGLQCIGQELINWTLDLPIPIDCFSIFTPQSSVWTRPNIVYTNLHFMDEIRYLANLSDIYTFHR